MNTGTADWTDAKEVWENLKIWRLDLVVYGATAHGSALCCDATLVSPLTRTGHLQPCTVEVDGAMLKVAERPSDGPSLDRVLDLAANEGASRLPLRP